MRHRRTERVPDNRAEPCSSRSAVHECESGGDFQGLAQPVTDGHAADSEEGNIEALRDQLEEADCIDDGAGTLAVLERLLRLPPSHEMAQELLSLVEHAQGKAALRTERQQHANASRVDARIVEVAGDVKQRWVDAVLPEAARQFALDTIVLPQLSVRNSSKSYAQLKARLRDAGLPTGGKKRKILQRLKGTCVFSLFLVSICALSPDRLGEQRLMKRSGGCRSCKTDRRESKATTRMKSECSQQRMSWWIRVWIRMSLHRSMTVLPQYILIRNLRLTPRTRASPWSRDAATWRRKGSLTSSA